MKNSIYKMAMGICFLLSITLANGQVKNATTETVKILGNCGMCKTTIETAGNKNKVAEVVWNKDTKMATLTFDSSKTNQSEILKRIALAGYDSESFLAPEAAYSKLPDCCQYDRTFKVAAAKEMKMNMKMNMKMDMKEGHDMPMKKSDTAAANQEQELSPVFDAYFLLNETLVKSDSKKAATIAADLLTALNAVKMEALPMKEHMVWMNVVKNLKEDAEHISETQDIKHQRDHYATLSTRMYDLMKVSSTAVPVYYNNCPMYNKGEGAKWLSQNKSIQNPYYGAKMLSCGSTVDTIK
jgi:copper chaperone CopZ